MHRVSTLMGAGIVAAIAAVAPAATVSITDSNGDPASISNLTPGSTFQVKTSLAVNPGEDVLGVSFRLNASQDGLFTIVSRTMDPGNPFTTVLTSNPTAPGSSPVMSPSNGADLGGYTPDFSTHGAGTYDLYTFTIQLSPTAPKGVYQIDASGVQLSDSGFNTISGDSTIYSVSVPEPMILGGVAMTSGGLLLRRRIPMPRRAK